MPTIALGDFNINNKEDKKFNIYKSQEKYWSVSHLNGCKNCKGTYYYYYENTCLLYKSPSQRDQA